MVAKAVEILGVFTVSDDVRADTSHIVAGGNRRTVKLLAGIVRGRWILSYDWVIYC